METSSSRSRRPISRGKNESKSDSGNRPRVPRIQPAPAWIGVSRGVALFFGALALLHVVAEMNWPGSDANFLWVDMRPLRPDFARGFLGFVGVCLILFAIFPRVPSPIRTLCGFATMCLLSVAIANAIQFYRLRQEGLVIAANDLSIYVHVAISLIIAMVGIASTPRPSGAPGRDFFVMLLTASICIIAFPVALMFCQGRADYRIKSDAVVVFDDHPGFRDEATIPEATTVARLVSQELTNRVIVAASVASDRSLKPIGDLLDLSLESFEAPAADGGTAQDALRRQRDTADFSNRLRVEPTLIDALEPATESGPALRALRRRFAETQAEQVMVVAPFYELPRLKLTLRKTQTRVATVPDRGYADVQTHKPIAREVLRFWGTLVDAARTRPAPVAETQPAVEESTAPPIDDADFEFAP